MTPQIFVDQIKRRARLGAPGNNADQAAADIVQSLNIRRFEVWRYHDWDWSLVDLEFTVGLSDFDKTMGSTVGEIYELNIKGQTGLLVRYSRRQYLKWQKQANSSDAGSLRGYIHRGRDSSGNLRLRFFDAPTTTTTIEGQAKKRISAMTTADITAGTGLEFFPEEMHGILFSLVLADMWAAMGDARSEKEEADARKQLKALRGEEVAEADTEPEDPPPDYQTFVSRNRYSGTRVV